MARIELAPEVAQDFERILDHLTSFGLAELEIVFVLAIRAQREAGYRGR